MLYRALQSQQLSLNPQEHRSFDAGSGVIMIPSNQIYVHWLTDKDNIRATYTMTNPTEIKGKVKLINSTDNLANVHVIKLA